MVHLHTFPLKKTIGLVLVVGTCSTCLFIYFFNIRSIEMEILHKPYKFVCQEKTNNAVTIKDAAADFTIFQWSHLVEAEESLPSVEPLKTSSYRIAIERHVQRIQNVKDVCAKRNLIAEISDRAIRFAYSKKYNFAYFPIPKIGSTFLKQMFAVLVRGQDKANDIYSIPRMDVHTSSRDIFHNLNTSEIRNAFVVVPTRNPYTRLYATYVDKVFLPISVRLAKDVRRITGGEDPCGRNQTFANFLKYALRPGKNRINTDHYDSSYEEVSTFVCSLNNFMLIQQETFSEDVELALQNAGVDKTEFDVIYDKLHDHRVELTVPGIVKTIYAKSEPYEKQCYPRSEVARRAWKSFQIQGFLHNDVNFPEDEFRSKSGKNLYADPDYVAQVILKYIKLRPITSAESKAQRRGFVLDAYKAVDDDTLKKIHEIYEIDFEMFQYDMDLNII